MDLAVVDVVVGALVLALSGRGFTLGTTSLRQHLLTQGSGGGAAAANTKQISTGQWDERGPSACLATNILS